jgi:hypothetical protein
MRKRTKTRAAAFRTNADSAAYDLVAEKNPATSKTMKMTAASGKPQTIPKRKSVIIWSGLRVAKVCCKTSNASPAIRLGNESKRQTI